VLQFTQLVVFSELTKYRRLSIAIAMIKVHAKSNFRSSQYLDLKKLYQKTCHPVFLSHFPEATDVTDSWLALKIYS
jgi:hypothetical protein